MKKFICIAFSAVALTFALTGCNANDGKVNNNAATSSPNAVNSSAVVSEVVTEANTNNALEDIGSGVENAVSDVGSGLENAGEAIVGTNP